eukprot:SAG11_NODE_422_length_9597_cov_11.289488_4_plen_554_part_00
MICGPQQVQKSRWLTAPVVAAVATTAAAAAAPAAPAAAAAAGRPTPLKCGVASDGLESCPSCLAAALKTGALDIFWNWNTELALDTSGLSTTELAQLATMYVPMIWGNSNPDSYAFLSSGATHVMGFNEPDQYGPQCDSDWHPPDYGCKEGEWRAASSSGWAPLFDPSTGVWEGPNNTGAPHAALYWQWLVNNMTQPGRRPPPPPQPCPNFKDHYACTNHTERCTWTGTECKARTPPGPPPPGPAPLPPPPGPPLPAQCKGTAHTKLGGDAAPIDTQCGGLKTFDCCERIEQHPANVSLAVGHNGCCDFFDDGALGMPRTKDADSTLIRYNRSAAGAAAVGSAAAAVALPPRYENSHSTLGDVPRVTVQKIVSPSMAQGAHPDNHSCIMVDPSKPNAIKFCQGWLKVFKQYASSLPCVNFAGQVESMSPASPWNSRPPLIQRAPNSFETSVRRQWTNCWDVIDVIQIHAYARTVEEVLQKIRGYYEVFTDDFEGLKGRSKKVAPSSPPPPPPPPPPSSFSVLLSLQPCHQELQAWLFRMVEVGFAVGLGRCCG